MSALPDAAPVLEVRGLRKSYRRGDEVVHALQGVELQVAAGELVVLLGRSGSGKTTLLSCILGWEDPDSGEVEVTAPGAATAWERTAVVPQQTGLLEELTLLENVALPARLAGVPAPRTAALHALEELQIAGEADRRPDAVSLGQAQRAALARALVVRPALLLADEPTSRLDEDLTRVVLAELRRRCHADGLAVLLASHDALATAYADRVVRLAEGRLAAG
ncbi:putative ABC transport system ATP-binding protein [Motilibacter rhizosphaerae]|uniref:Putative ABC transport system ATP-binding protein n=1 Tax=Motilibacter rhizosphaerae TaxID=598652 RepID=A0A4Q7NU41_9ACTN|nr:ATP-binding cassette domain-containing protein [Motilibacter rhizosphaerae]RZS89932.1 putative ABC transport system ATP-binding protein [Motilibacter rhizosphaerae]